MDETITLGPSDEEFENEWAKITKIIISIQK